MKNTYITYAEKNGIEIGNSEVLETIDVDMAKVQALAKYINRVVNSRDDIENGDYTQLFSDDIIKNYSKIMNLQWYSFGDLESVKGIVGENAYIDGLHLKIEEDSITRPDDFRPDIAYGTPEYLKLQYESVMSKVKELHTTNAFANSKFDILKVNKEKQALRRYIQENGIEGIDIEIPQVETNHNMTNMIADALMEQYGAEYEDKEAMRSRILTKLEDNWSEIMTDDPTARPKLDLNDTMIETIMKMTDGNPGAIVGLTSMLKADKTGGMLLLGLDDMNIRGSQIWEAYKYLYHEDGEKFAKAVSKRDPKMVDFINQELASVGGEKAVTGGASFDRHKTPNKYRFTEEEVEQLKQQREERIAREKEQREKMLANSPAKKNRGAKKRAEREAKKQAYRQKLIAMGKKSLGELDEELTDLQGKEQQAKELCEQYEQQLPDKSHQEI